MATLNNNITITAKLTIDNSESSLLITDTTDYNLAAITEANAEGYLRIDYTPKGGSKALLYLNNSFIKPDINPDVSRVFQLNEFCCQDCLVGYCGKIEVTYSILEGSTEWYRKFSFEFCYEEREPELDITLDCYGATLTAVDTTDYEQEDTVRVENSYELSVEEKTTPYTDTTTNTILSATNPNLITEKTYTFKVASQNTYTYLSGIVIEVIQEAQSPFIVRCPNPCDLACSIACLREKAGENSLLLKKWREAIGLFALYKASIDCLQPVQATKFLNRLYDLLEANSTPLDVNCNPTIPPSVIVQETELCVECYNVT